MQRGGLLSPGSQLHPYSVASSNTLLPPVVGSPCAFQHPVPVVSGYNSLLPVDVTHLNIFFSVFLFGIDISSRNGEKHFGSFACFPQLFVFQMQRCFDLFHPPLQCVLLDYEFMIKMNFVCVCFLIM